MLLRECLYCRYAAVCADQAALTRYSDQAHQHLGRFGKPSLYTAANKLARWHVRPVCYTSSMRRAWKVIAFIGQSAILGLAGAFVLVLVKPEFLNLPVNRAAVPVNSYADAVAASSPAVANIYTAHRVGSSSEGNATALRGEGRGSAVVIDQDGYLVTNWHVIRGADQIRVQLADGRIMVPRLVGSDPDTELALLHIDASDLPSIKLGRSDLLEVGEVVLAIGNSLGLSQTVTMGIVSATGRGQLGVANFEDFIQTDAAINIGNSGGALVNANGELVGINTAVISSSFHDRAVPEGIGFAIPVNLVRGVMAQLIEHGRVIRGYLGVDTADLSPLEAQQFGIEGSAVQLHSVRGPAIVAGLLPGDVLTHIDGQRVLNQQQAMNLVASSRPGDKIRIRVARIGGQVIDTDAVLEERPPQPGSGVDRAD